VKKTLFALLMLFSASGFAAQNVLTWQDNSDNEIGFEIFRKTEACMAQPPVAPWAPLATVGPDVETYTDATVVEGSTYCYTLRAMGAGGVFSDFSNAADRAVPVTPPAPPSNLTVQ